MTAIHLFLPYWQHKNAFDIDFYIKGWAEYKQIMYDAEKLSNLVAEIIHPFDIIYLNDFLLQLNGNFSIIIHTKDVTVLCVDKTRCFPIVYFQHNKGYYITDNLDVFQRKHPDMKLKINEAIIIPYLCSNYVIGHYTKYANVFSVQAGEIVKITNGQYIRQQYFQWIPKMGNDGQLDLSVESSVMESVYTKAIKRMIKSAPDVHNWIIPLSGGYDSRMIVNYLYKSNIKNVVCFSYGVKNNNQSMISEKVAKALGYKWYFIEHTSDIISEIQQSKEIEKYRKYAFNGTSTPNLQDFIAVFQLKKMGVVQSGDIFIPGHSHDFITGSHLKSGMEYCSSTKESLPFILKHFYELGYAKRNVELYKHILSIVEQYKINCNQIPEYFTWQERHAKLIVNSVKVYEYFGFEWRIPLWDNDLINYWIHIGFNWRNGRKMLLSIIKQSDILVDAIKTIPFANNMKAKKPLKTQIAKFVPWWLKKILRSLHYSKSAYFVPEGLHLLYSDHQETISDYKNCLLVPEIVKKYVEKYPKNMKFCYLPVNSVSTLMLLKDEDK